MPNQSEQVNEIAAALAKANTELGPLFKNKTVKVRPKSGTGEYTFDYATFDNLIEHVRGPLTSNGMWFAQTTRIPEREGYAVVLVTTVYHQSGQWISSEMFVPDNGNNQEFGSSLSYRKRYALASILGLVADEDEDANTADGNSVLAKTEKAIPPKPGDDERRSRAVKWGEDAIKKLAAFKSLKEFDAWHVPDNRAKVAAIKAYDPALHASLIAAIDSVLAKYNPIGS